MRYIGADGVHTALDYEPLIERLRNAFQDEVNTPSRHHHPITRSDGPDSMLLLMPAWRKGGKLGVKLVTFFPRNSDQGLATIQGLYVVFDETDGTPELVMDGVALTLRRTSCASALAASYLARKDASVLIMVGAGALAPHLIRAHCAVRPIKEILIWNRHIERALALAKSCQRDGLNATASDDLESAVRTGDIISCATMSEKPLVQGRWLKHGCHLDLVGSFKPSMREVDDEAVQRARIFVDTRNGAGTEAGDLVNPMKRGVIGPDAIIGDLFELTRNSPGRRTKNEITLFKSVGTAIEDLAAAEMVVERS
tara:strand:- start:5697 stop:6629 length:933 start_codon:yes stop_codon:yes gene_type:complete